MKLVQLLEAIGDLVPGEKRITPEMNLRNLVMIQNRILDLQSAIEKSNDLKYLFQKDQDIQNRLNGLIQRVNRRIEILQKVQAKPTSDMQRMFQTLDAECSQFIPSMQQAGKFLYRGVNNNEQAFEGRSREGRTPKDSNPEISNMFDTMMAQLGVQALRSNSIYTTSSYGFASSYGWEVYIIFPKNSFHFLGTNQKDLILEKWSQLVDMDLIKHKLREINDWAQEHIQSNWQSSSLYGAIKHSEWDYALRLLKDNWKWDSNYLGLPEEYNLDMKLFVTPQSVEANFQPNTTDLAPLIKSGHECLINGEYWALNKRLWEHALRARYLPDDQIDPYS